VGHQLFFSKQFERLQEQTACRHVVQAGEDPCLCARYWAPYMREVVRLWRRDE